MKFHGGCPQLNAIQAALTYLRAHLEILPNEALRGTVAKGIINLLVPGYLPKGEYQKVEGGLLLCNNIPQTVVSRELVAAVEHVLPGLQVVVYDQWAALETIKVFNAPTAEQVALPVFTALQTALKTVLLGAHAPVMALLPD